jgi:signal transduction histidine kinase
MTWVSPQRLLDRWQPEMFRARFLELDQQIASWQRIAKLSDLVSIVQRTENDDASDVTWKVSAPNGITRSFPDPASDESFRTHKAVLPDQALLVTRTWFGEPKVIYWDSKVHHGKGAVDSSFFVLVSRTGESIAWLHKALMSECGLLQLKRYSVGSTIHSITASDLLDMKIQIPTEQERARMGRLVLDAEQQASTALRTRSLSKSTILTGRTQEERLNEFETLLFRELHFSPTDVYFVEPATRNRGSDLFAVRRLDGRQSPAATSLVPQEVQLVSERWRNWFWDSDLQSSHRVFNSLSLDAPLPAYLLLHLTPDIPSAITEKVVVRLLPDFTTFRDAILDSLSADVGVEDSLWASEWCALQEDFASTVDRDRAVKPSSPSEARSSSASIDFAFEQDLFEWSRRIYRPVLAVKIRHDNDIIGAYLIVGDDQVYNREPAFARLDDLGVELTEILQPTSSTTDEVLRRESLRRMNDIMHRLNGPLLNATDALGDIREFLDDHPRIAVMLVPNEEQAMAMAEMNRDSSAVGYQLSSRFEVLSAAIEQIRGLSTQVKTLARIEERLSLTDVRLAELERALSQYSTSVRPSFSYEGKAHPELHVIADRDLVIVALSRVLDNAIRELQEKNTDLPQITVTFGATDDDVRIQVEDNALPADEWLPENVFDERVSKYFTSNKGSGFGLMSVYRIFQRHGRSVSLKENFDSAGERQPGVTFTATLRCSPKGDLFDVT